MNNEYYIGLMSGTSMDGIDAALISCTGPQVALVATYQHPWEPDLQRQLISTQRKGHSLLGELAELDARCGIAFAQAANALLREAGLAREQLTAICSHGSNRYIADGRCQKPTTTTCTRFTTVVLWKNKFGMFFP